MKLGQWFAALLFAFAGVTSWLAWGVEPPAGPGEQPVQVAPVEKLVSLEIDFGDGFAKRYSALAWKPEMTVMDAMEQVMRHGRPTKFGIRGRAANALLLQIDDLKSEGAGQRNWIYRVNKQKGDKSFAVFPLQQGDVVMWKFETYE